MAILEQHVQPMRCYIHKETTNQSFLDMHYYLKSIGIANNDFFLALLNPNLAGVDPRDPLLTPQQKAMVLVEIQYNYWYFLREVVRIPVQGSSTEGGARYRLDRGSLAMNFLFILNFNMFVELPRQHGKTTTALCRYLWVYNFGTTNSKIMFMHKAHSGSKDNLKTLKTLRDALPGYLQMSGNIGVNGEKLKVPDTVVNVEHPFNHNSITTFPSARNKDAADNLGRGLSFPAQYYDEFAFMPFNKTVYLAATPAFSTASQNAAKNGAPYGILITTTPGDLLTDSGQYAYDMRNDATKFNEQFYDFTVQELYDLRNSNTNSDFFHIRFTYQQLGSGQDYFMKMVKLMNRNWPEIRREVMLEWSQIATECPFSEEDLDVIKTHLKPPIRTILFGRFRQYQFEVYEDIDLLYPPIVGVDVSGAEYQDSSTITVIDSHTTRVCACFNCNFIDAEDLSHVIYELVTRYLPSAVVNIELNGGFGRGIVQRLVKTSIKKNLYREEKEKVIEEAYNGVRLDKVKRKVMVYGTTSTKDVRARLIEILFERVRYHKDKFVSQIIYDEMKAMEVKKSGKIEHSQNSHDDQVFSYLMALYVWYDGKNLAQNWHVQKNTIKTDQDEELIEDSFEDALEAKEEVPLENAIYEEGSEAAQAIRWIEENSHMVNSNMMKEKEHDQMQVMRDNILSVNKQARQQYADSRGLVPEMFESQDNKYNFVKLPDAIYTGFDDNFTYMDDDEDDITFNTGNNYIHSQVVQGNLADIFNKL